MSKNIQDSEIEYAIENLILAEKPISTEAIYKNLKINKLRIKKVLRKWLRDALSLKFENECFKENTLNQIYNLALDKKNLNVENERLKTENEKIFAQVYSLESSKEYLERENEKLKLEINNLNKKITTMENIAKFFPPEKSLSPAQ